MKETLSIEGRWWEQDKPNEAHHGILTFDPEKEISLQIKIFKTTPIAEIFESARPEAPTVKTFFGRDKNDRPITLFNAHQSGSNRSQGLTSYKYDAVIALCGAQYPSREDASFDEVRLDFTNLNPWFMFPAFTDRKDEGGVHYIGVSYPNDICFPIRDGASLDVMAILNQNAENGAETTLKLSERRIFTLRQSKPISLKDALEWVSQLKRFLSLAQGYRCYPTSITGVVKQIDGRTIFPPKEIEVFTDNRGVSDVQLRKLPDGMFFSFHDVEDRLGNVLVRYLDFDEKCGSVLDLYFSVVFNKHLYLNHQFLFLAQALERYHAVMIGGTKEPKDVFKERLVRVRKALEPEDAKLFDGLLSTANGKPFRRRIEEILSSKPALLADIPEGIPDFVSTVCDTRNYNTHFGTELFERGRVAKGIDLIRLTEILRILLEVLILDELGVGDKAIQRAKSKKAAWILSFE